LTLHAPHPRRHGSQGRARASLQDGSAGQRAAHELAQPTNNGGHACVGGGELAHGRVREHHVRRVDVQVQDTPEVRRLVLFQASYRQRRTRCSSAAQRPGRPQALKDPPPPFVRKMCGTWCSRRLSSTSRARGSACPPLRPTELGTWSALRPSDRLRAQSVPDEDAVDVEGDAERRTAGRGGDRAGDTVERARGERCALHQRPQHERPREHDRRLLGGDGHARAMSPY
jgi:hypothetical protein